MNELNLLISIKILEMRMSSLDPLLTMYEELVVLGLFVEVVTVTRDWRHELRDFWRGTIHTPENPGLAKLLWGLAGTILIAVGVAGEVAIHLDSSRIEVEMRDTMDILAAETTEEARTAKDLVDEAKADVSALESEAERIRSKIAWRSLTTEQQGSLASHVKKFAGQKYFVLWRAPYPDPEMLDLSQTINDALGMRAGWIRISYGGGSGGNWAPGVAVVVLPSCTARTRRAANALASWFKEHGIVLAKLKRPQEEREALSLMTSFFANPPPNTSGNPNEGIGIFIGIRP